MWTEANWIISLGAILIVVACAYLESWIDGTQLIHIGYIRRDQNINACHIC